MLTMLVFTRSLVLGLLMAVTCLSLGCSSEPVLDPEQDKPVMDNVPAPAP
jgi:hypothetical protein